MGSGGGMNSGIMNSDMKKRDTTKFKDEAELSANIAAAQKEADALNATGAVGTDGLLNTGASVNRYGIMRPGSTLLRNEAGELDSRFESQMGEEYQMLRDKAMTEGDTKAAQIAREQQAALTGTQMDQMRQMSGTGQQQAQRQMAMRGGLGGGARERMAAGSAQNLMTGLQGIGGADRQAQMSISAQDEASKNALLGQVGGVSQGIQDTNISRLIGDIQQQNQTSQNVYKEDMSAYGAIKSAEAQARAACFDGDTEVVMSDNTKKKIKDIIIGDMVKVGGYVHTVIQAISNDLYLYKGITVSGLHAVCEDGEFLRIKDSKHSKLLEGHGIVYCLGNQMHKMVIEGILFADFYETDEYGDISEDESIKRLNGKIS